MMTREPSTYTVPPEIAPVEPPAGAGKPHTMSVFAQGANTPTVRLQGRWLGQAGFPVGARSWISAATRIWLLGGNE